MSGLDIGKGDNTVVFTAQWLQLQEDIKRVGQDAERARQAGDAAATMKLEREHNRLQVEADQIPESDRHVQGAVYDPAPWQAPAVPTPPPAEGTVLENADGAWIMTSGQWVRQAPKG